MLAFTRYSFSSRPLYTKQYYYSRTPPLFGHPTLPLNCQHYCAIQCFPPTIIYCNTCNTRLVMAISCKGQCWPLQKSVSLRGLCASFKHRVSPPTRIAHTIALLLHDYYELYDPPPTPLCMPCTVQYWSWQYCEGQILFTPDLHVIHTAAHSVPPLGFLLGGGDDDFDCEASLRRCSLCVCVSGLFCCRVLVTC